MDSKHQDWVSCKMWGVGAGGFSGLPLHPDDRDKNPGEACLSWQASSLTPGEEGKKHLQPNQVIYCHSNKIHFNSHFCSK